MTNDKGPSRLKRNQKCRQILTSASIDLDYLSVQNTSKSLHLSGKLIKLNKQPCTPEELSLILEKLKKITKNLTTDLENWDLNGWEVRKLNKQIINDDFKPIQKVKKKKDDDEEDDIIIDLF